MFESNDYSGEGNDASQDTGPLITRAEALEPWQVQSQRYASNCILLAVVTSTDLAAELINSAIDSNKRTTAALA